VCETIDNYLLNVIAMSELHQSPNEIPLYLRVEQTPGGTSNIYLKTFEQYWIDDGGVYQGANFMLRIVVDVYGNISDMGYWSGEFPNGVTVVYDTFNSIFTMDVQTTDLTSVQLGAFYDPTSGYP
jgi:hypothetical protein